jgi:hypothetical protein
VPAGRAVIPGPGQGHRPECRIDDLGPVGNELRLMPLPARHPGAAVAGIGGQQLPEQAAARGQHPGADHRLRRGRHRRSPANGRLPPPGGLSRRISPARAPRRAPFFALRHRGASVPATGLASQIFSFTSMICPTAAVNSACRATSRRTFSASAAASCRPTVLRRPADRVHRNRGPCPR